MTCRYPKFKLIEKARKLFRESLVPPKHNRFVMDVRGKPYNRLDGEWTMNGGKVKEEQDDEGDQEERMQWKAE